MKLFKKKKKQSFLRRFWPWLIPASFLVLIILLLSPYLFRPWIKYPENIRARLAWEAFSKTFTSSCHEDCLSSRQALAEVWRPYYSDNPQEAKKYWQEVLLGENENLKEALIKILAADSKSSELPEIISEAMTSSQLSAQTRLIIAREFPEHFYNENWLASLENNLSDTSLSVEERLYSFKLLLSLSNKKEELAKMAILENYPPSIEKQAQVFLALENNISWSREEITQLSHLIKTSEGKLSRWQRLLLLSRYGQAYPELLSESLSNIAANQALDSISRGLAAESLKKLFNIIIITPSPGASEWQEFYELI